MMNNFSEFLKIQTLNIFFKVEKINSKYKKIIKLIFLNRDSKLEAIF